MVVIYKAIHDTNRESKGDDEGNQDVKFIDEFVIAITEQMKIHADLVEKQVRAELSSQIESMQEEMRSLKEKHNQELRDLSMAVKKAIQESKEAQEKPKN